MAIGRFEPKHASGVGKLSEAIRIALDEALTALAESFHGLTDEQFWAFPLPGRHNIVTLVEHCIQCLDLYACEVQGRPLVFEPAERFDIWNFSAAELRPKMVDLPTVPQEQDRVAELGRAIMEHLAAASEEDLRLPNRRSWWFQEYTDRVRADAYLRCTSHTMSHVRQIWFLRGLMGLDDTAGWPEQHWA